jgi:UTP--glucose-1-phosphate uridylyltransferase
MDPAILGAFIASGKEVMVEVCDKAPGDRGGIPVHARGRLQILEEFRLPKGFDASRVTVFNTNTFLVRAEALDSAQLAWTYFEVEKKVEGRPAIQFERLLQELTAVLPAAYLRVPREGDVSRFLPVKDNDELTARRADIAAVARKRGMVPAAKTA